MKTDDNNNSLNSSSEQNKGLSNFLSRTAKKVGFTVYDMVTDGLFQIAQETSRTSESEEDRNTAKALLNYITTRMTEYEGNYIAEDESMAIRVEKCTTAKMDFIIASKMYSKSIKCTGKFISQNKVLYSGQHCTLTITLCSEDELILKGKLPWEENEIELYFTSSRLLVRKSQYEGDYVAANDSMVIRVKRCTTAKMDFIIASKEQPEVIDHCSGKFIEEDKVLYSGENCALMITWRSEEDFILEGKLPWEEDEIELHFLSSNLYANIKNYLEENNDDLRVLGSYIYTNQNQGILLNIDQTDDEYKDFQVFYLSNMHQAVTEPKKVNANVIFHQKGKISIEDDIIYAAFSNEDYKLIFVWEDNDTVTWTRIMSQDNETTVPLKRKSTGYIDKLIETLKNRMDIYGYF